MLNRLDDFPSVVKQVEINTEDIEHLKAYRIECEADRKAKSEVQNQLLQDSKAQKDCLLRIEMLLTDALPTVNRAKGRDLIFDTLKLSALTVKEWAIWITSISAAVYVIYQIFK